MKKCLITGAAGQIGIKLLNELIKYQKYEICATGYKIYILVVIISWASLAV